MILGEKMVKELRNGTWKQIENDRIAIVKLYTNWCGPCKLLKPKFTKWSDTFKVYNDTKIKYYELNGDKCSDFKKLFNIDRYPTTLFFVYGVLVFTQHGMTSERIHEDLLRKTLEIKYERTENGI